MAADIAILAAESGDLAADIEQRLPKCAKSARNLVFILAACAIADDRLIQTKEEIDISLPANGVHALS